MKTGLLKRLYLSYYMIQKFYFLCVEYLPFFHMEFVNSLSGNSWAFLFLPLSLCHVNFHKEETGFFLFFFRTNSWNLETCLGIQLKLEAQLVVWNYLTGSLTGIRD